MKRQRRFQLWIIPVLGIFFGIIYAFMFIHGLVVTWHFIGKPDEKIDQIIGIVDGHQLFVRTETGDIYSIDYYHHYRINELSSSIHWKKEEISSIQPDPPRYATMKFVSLPLFVNVKQKYEMSFQINEGELLVKFVLSKNGNLWMWNYGQGGMAPLTYFIFPVIGLVGGSIFAVIVRLIILIVDKSRK